jgi:hypothetical protein
MLATSFAGLSQILINLTISIYSTALQPGLLDLP